MSVEVSEIRGSVIMKAAHRRKQELEITSSKYVHVMKTDPMLRSLKAWLNLLMKFKVLRRD